MTVLMFNVYAQRATRPDDMEHALNPALHAENRKAFRYLLSLSDQPAVRVMGNIILKQDYLMDCMRDFAADGKAAGAKWYTAGPLLKSGQPHHLYLKKDTQLLDFDIDAICALSVQSEIEQYQMIPAVSALRMIWYCRIEDNPRLGRGR